MMIKNILQNAYSMRLFGEDKIWQKYKNKYNVGNVNWSSNIRKICKYGINLIKWYKNKISSIHRCKMSNKK